MTGIDALNRRGQTYDDASNIVRKYSGLQTRIKKINSAAEYVPCTAHYLNSVRTNAV